MSGSGFTFTYAEVGATRERRTPAGYLKLGTEARLGDGEACFVRAKEALRGWAHFRIGWLRLLPAPVEEGAVVRLRLFGFLPMGACAVVWVRDEPRRFEFAYGTLPGHVEKGEERFAVVLRDDGSVWFEVESFSRMASPLLVLVAPIARRFQRRFLRDACEAMRRAV